MTSPLPPLIHLFLLTDTPPTETYTLSLHDALPISFGRLAQREATLRRAVNVADHQGLCSLGRQVARKNDRSEEHTSELQSRGHLVCRLLLEKKKVHDDDRIAKPRSIHRYLNVLRCV